MGDYIYIDIDLVEATTLEAVLFIIEDREEWIPKSVLSQDTLDALRNPNNHDSIDQIDVEVWFAEQRGLI